MTKLNVESFTDAYAAILAAGVAGDDHGNSIIVKHSLGGGYDYLVGEGSVTAFDLLNRIAPKFRVAWGTANASENHGPKRKLEVVLFDGSGLKENIQAELQSMSGKSGIEVSVR